MSISPKKVVAVAILEPYSKSKKKPCCFLFIEEAKRVEYWWLLQLSDNGIKWTLKFWCMCSHTSPWSMDTFTLGKLSALPERENNVSLALNGILMGLRNVDLTYILSFAAIKVSYTIVKQFKFDAA